MAAISLFMYSTLPHIRLILKCGLQPMLELVRVPLHSWLTVGHCLIRGFFCSLWNLCCKMQTLVLRLAPKPACKLSIKDAVSMNGGISLETLFCCKFKSKGFASSLTVLESLYNRMEFLFVPGLCGFHQYNILGTLESRGVMQSRTFASSKLEIEYWATYSLLKTNFQDFIWHFSLKHITRNHILSNDQEYSTFLMPYFSLLGKLRSGQSKRSSWLR